MVDLLRVEHAIHSLRTEISVGRFVEPGSQENYLRVRLWWSANDRVRHLDGVATPPCPESVFRNNLESFIKNLTGTDPTEALTRAEALRELGRFAEAEEALRIELPDNCAYARQKISELVRRRETSVARMS